MSDNPLNSLNLVVPKSLDLASVLPVGPLPAFFGPVGTETTTGVGSTRGSFDPIVGNPLGLPITKSALSAQQQAVSDAMTSVLGMTGSIEGFHGTPHTFDPVEGNPLGAFRDQAIGSGEGAQAYGWGHYVAGNKGIAEGYRDKLSGNDTAGNLYHVEIAPDEQQLLDWDKPLEQQSPEVKEKLSPLSLRDTKQTGGEMYSSLYSNPANTSSKLNDLGIPGLKYLDASSRRLPQQWLLNGEKMGIDPTENDVLEHLDTSNDLSENEAKKEAQNLLVTKVRLGDTSKRSALQWLNDNMENLTRSEHPDVTRNYVIFHPSNLKITGRNGEMLGLEPTEGNPFGE